MCRAAYYCWGGLLLGALALSARSDAADGSLEEGLARFFKVGWSTAPSAYQPTIEVYKELRELAPTDRRLPYAAALVLMQQRKYDLAAKRVEELLADDEHDLAAWRARIWLHTITKNYSAAMSAAEKSTKFLVTDDKSEPTEEATAEYVASLGRIFGYLGGPVAEQVKADERKASERRIVEKLTSGHQEIFVDARDGVLDRFLKLTDSATETRERTKVEAEKEKAKALDEIQKEREQQSDRRRELQERRDKTQSELKDKLNELNKEDAPLQREQARLQGQVGPLQASLLTIDSEIGRLQALLATEKDPRQRDFFRFEIDRLIIRGNSLRGQLGALDRQLGAVTSQRVALQAQASQAQGEAGARIDKAGKEMGQLDKKEKQLDGLENRASRPSTGTTSRTAALGAQAGALTTYEPFPLEAEKQRLLDSFR